MGQDEHALVPNFKQCIDTLTGCPGASGQHMAEFVAIAEVDSEADVEAGVEVDATAAAGAEVVREAAG
jgi:hypothetical protein